jgi:anti-anti-sigma regulatory factor
VSYQARGRVVIIALPARVESASILALRSRSERAILSGSHTITIDLRATHHIDASTLSDLGNALDRISLHSPTIAVVGADPRVQ